VALGQGPQNHAPRQAVLTPTSFARLRAGRGLPIKSASEPEGPMRKFFIRLPLLPLVIFAFTLGLAPFLPEPHILQKIKLLITGDLVRPIDMADLLLHATPWLLLALKIAYVRPED